MNKTKTERGQSLVEMAISLVLLLLLLSGAVEFGIAFFQFVQLRDAAQEGALYASLHPTDTAGIKLRIKEASDSPIDLSAFSDSAIEITITGPACEGSAVKVKLIYDHKVFMPFMSGIVGSTLPLRASVTDTILSPICP